MKDKCYKDGVWCNPICEICKMPVEIRTHYVIDGPELQLVTHADCFIKSFREMLMK